MVLQKNRRVQIAGSAVILKSRTIVNLNSRAPDARANIPTSAWRKCICLRTEVEYIGTANRSDELNSIYRPKRTILYRDTGALFALLISPERFVSERVTHFVIIRQIFILLLSASSTQGYKSLMLLSNRYFFK